MDLPHAETIFHVPLYFGKPGNTKFAPVARFHLETLRKRSLVREIVADHPVVPRQFCPVRNLRKPRKKTGRHDRSVRCWAKYDPAASRKIRFHPTVRIPGPPGVIAAQSL